LPKIDFTKFFLTERQAMKKSMMMSDPNNSEEDAQFVVYGKLKYKEGLLEKNISKIFSDNENKDPDCVDYDYAISENHPLKDEIKKKFKEFKRAIRIFIINAKDLIKNIASTIKNIPTQMGAAVAALIVTPPTAGAANVLIMFKSLIAALSALLSKLPIILSSLGPFSFLQILIPDELITGFVTPINTILAVLNVSLGLISTIYGFIKPITLIAG